MQIKLAHADVPKIAGEYAVKAAFLFKFAKFVEWPKQSFAASTSPLLLTVLGDSPFDLALDELNGKMIAEHKVLISYTNDVSVAKNSHVVFVSASHKYALPQLLKEFRNRPVLLVSDIEQFASQGGMIGFIVRDNKVGFEINVEVAKQSGLELSSKLLGVAKLVSTTLPL